MPQAVICLDCNALFPADPVTRANRCPACMPAHKARANARRRPHKPTPARQEVQRFYGSSAWKRASERVRMRDGGCTACGTAENLSVHHVISRKERPDLALDYGNLVTLCKSCHGLQENAKRRHAHGVGGAF